MKQIRRSLLSISKNLKALTQRTDKMIKVLDKLEKAQAKKSTMKKKTAKRAAPKKIGTRKVAAGKGKRLSATQTVLKVINRSKKGVDTATLQKKTGYHNRKIWDIVHRAYKEGKIKKVGRGLYTKA